MGEKQALPGPILVCYPCATQDAERDSLESLTYAFYEVHLMEATALFIQIHQTMSAFTVNMNEHGEEQYDKNWTRLR